MDTSAKAFVEHWRWAAAKGLMNPNTAGGLRSACTKVAEVLDEKEAADVTKIDVEGVLKRFENLKHKAYKPTVLETYKSRFRSAVESFRAYAQDPAGWTPGLNERPRSARKVTDGGRGQVESPVQPLAATGLVEYPFPIRDGLTARLTLPRDLTAAEAKRLSAFVAALATDQA